MGSTLAVRLQTHREREHCKGWLKAAAASSLEEWESSQEVEDYKSSEWRRKSWEHVVTGGQDSRPQHLSM